MRAVRQRFHESQHLVHRLARGQIGHDGRSHDAAIRDAGDAFGCFGGADAEADDHRQIGLRLDPRHFGADIGGLCRRRPGDAGDATKTAVNLFHEIFNNFLAEGPYQNYMVEVFNEPEE